MTIGATAYVVGRVVYSEIILGKVSTGKDYALSGMLRMNWPTKTGISISTKHEHHNPPFLLYKAYIFSL